MRMTVVSGSFYQFFAANSQDLRRHVDHLAPEGKVNCGCRTTRTITRHGPKTRQMSCRRQTPSAGPTARKAAVVDAVLSGVNTIEEVCRRYDLTVDELLAAARSWLPMAQADSR